MVFLNGAGHPRARTRGVEPCSTTTSWSLQRRPRGRAFILPEKEWGEHWVAEIDTGADVVDDRAHEPAAAKVQPRSRSCCAARASHTPALRSRHDPPDVTCRPPTAPTRPRGPHGDLPPAGPRRLRVRRRGRARRPTSPRSASRTSTCPRCSRRRRARCTATTCSTTPGSREEAGGREAFQRLVAACREAGLGIVVDVVPNHMTVPEPTHLNAPFWSLLRDGRRSPYAGWFDVDWVAEGERILMPVLGGTVEQALERGDVTLADDGGPTGHEWVLRHYGDEFPVAPGTETLPLSELVDAQAYRLSSWREAGEALNYRRFFDVTSLVAVRVEDPDRLHGHPRAAARPARPRRGRRLPDRPPRRPRRPGRLPRAAGRRHRRRLGRRREDPRGRRAAARQLALRRDHRLRRPAAGAAGAHVLRRRRRRSTGCGRMPRPTGSRSTTWSPRRSGWSSTTCRPRRSTG